MSDLQCPATLLIARHGDSRHTLHGFLSDDGGWLTDLGRAQVGELAETLLPRRVAAVFSSSMRRAVESAELAAAHLGVKSFVVDGLQELSTGGAEDGHAVVRRFAEALEGIADTHRGETVLVLTHSGVMSLVIPRLSVNVRNDLAAQRPPPNCDPAEVVVDADGWRVISWPT